ncbi:MAG TPA: hypothetical protein VEZ55_06240 [Chitinophagaceae bacterium]|jgi:hypothetical protein|nr:hypothetical protein [Chitinophagaceae bacterium]
MSIKEFNDLVDNDQREAIIDGGIFLCTRTLQSYHISLFQIDAFYVEVWRLAGSKRGGLMFAFDSVDLLDPYLSSINISELVEPIK